MRFLNQQPAYDLTYNDVFMAPNRSSVQSRHDVDLTSRDGIDLPLPLVVANMTAISGRRMAETVARRGGIAVLPQDIPVDYAAKAINRVKSSPTAFETPVVLGPTMTVGEALALVPKRAHGTAVIIDDGNHPIGLFSPSDAAGVDRFVQLHDVMTTDLTVVDADTAPQKVFEALASSRHRLSIGVDADGTLVGVMSQRGAVRCGIYAPALDEDGRLRIGVAIGISGDAQGRARALLDAHADVLVMDTAHGHQERMLDAHRAHVVEVDDAVLEGELAHFLALLGALDVLVGREVVHDKRDLGLVEDLLEVRLAQHADGYRAGDVVGEREVDIGLYKLARHDGVEARVRGQNFLRHGHSHEGSPFGRVIGWRALRRRLPGGGLTTFGSLHSNRPPALRLPAAPPVARPGSAFRRRGYLRRLMALIRPLIDAVMMSWCSPHPQTVFPSSPAMPT